jgi:hypothetical protein
MAGLTNDLETSPSSRSDFLFPQSDKTIQTHIRVCLFGNRVEGAVWDGLRQLRVYNVTLFLD